MQGHTEVARQDETTLREKVDRFESILAQAPQLFIPIEHTLHGGLYIRMATIPAGAYLTGAACRRDHVCAVMGDIDVTTDEGPRRLLGLNFLRVRAGMKRAGRALTDTRWALIVRTDATTVEDAEADLVEHPEQLQSRLVIDAPAAATLEA